MMGNNNTTEYKVLWVTDKDDSFVKAKKAAAYEAGRLRLRTFFNWDEAEADLNKNFKDYSAIILSPKGKLHRDSDKNEECVSFLMVVLSQLREIFAFRHDTIAWYILGTGVEEISEIERNTAKEIRGRMSLDDNWGEDMMFEMNSHDEETLFAKIIDVAEKRQQNAVLFRHKETFSYIGKNLTIKYESAREELVDILVALYNPHFKLDTVAVYKNYANALRQILESMFIAAGERGLLPIECFHNRDNTNPNLMCSVNYISGFGVLVDKIKGKYIRWGQTKNHIGGVFSPEDAKYLYEMLDYFNKVSHFQDSDKVEGDKELFFSYCMRLCHIICRFGDYVKTYSPDPIKNRSFLFKDVSTPIDPDDVINTKARVKYENGVLSVGKCKIDAPLIEGQTFIVEAAIKNTDPADNGTYPFIATKIRPSVFVQDKFRMTVVGETFNVINDLSKNGRDYCFKNSEYLENYKLSSSAVNEIMAKSNIMDWKIEEEEDSDEIDNWKYPRLVTKISPV